MRDVISKLSKGFYSQSGLLFILAVTLKVDGPDMSVKWWNSFDEGGSKKVIELNYAIDHTWCIL